ncbi:MAG: bacillolysin, partial [Acidobacteria bacterium]|nr:bacillolysin [Acidobacteriota bacterium]
MRRALAISLIFFALPLAADEFRVDRVLESLTGTYRHSTQLIDGIEVVGGEKIERIRRDGTSDVVYERALQKAPVTIMAATSPRDNATRVYVDVNGVARPAWKIILYERPLEPFAEYYDAATGALLRRDPLFWNAKARVFEANPVVKLNDPSLRDQNNIASAVPDVAYSIVELDNIAASGSLVGPYVQIVDTE